jgi:hypothetical protein
MRAGIAFGPLIITGKSGSTTQGMPVPCRELRSLCPRNAKVINIEVTGDDRQLPGRLQPGRISVVLPKPRVSHRACAIRSCDKD